MGRLLKYPVYFTVLALAVAIGAYVVLGPVSLEDIVPSHPEQKAAAAHLQPTPSASAEPPAAAPASASTDNEQGYGVAQGLESLASYAQSATAKVEQLLFASAPDSASTDNEKGYGATARVEQLLLANRAAAPGNAEVSTGASTDARAVSESTGLVSPPSGDAVPATAAVSNDASQDAKAVNEAARPAAPVAGTDVAAGTEIAALTPNGICQRDGDRLARLRSNPSSDEATRFANDLGCEALRPQVVALMQRLTPALADASNGASSDAQATREDARPAPPVVHAGVADLASDEACRRDGDRLARLRASPSGKEAQRFASELGCEALRPQVLSLTESLANAIPATAAAAVSNDVSRDAKPADKPMLSAPSVGTDGAAESQLAALAPDGPCQRDKGRLAQLRNNPSRDEAARFANELGCEKLRPQLLALIESLEPAPAAPDVSSAASPGAQTENETAHPSAGLAGANVASSTSEETCKRDEERLVRLGSNPSGDEALRFVKELGCEKLLPQLQRLLRSLDFDASAPQAPSDSAHSNPMLGQTCANERAALDRLRQEPSAEAAGLFWRNLQCEGLRPQVRLLMESLNVAPDSVGSAAAPGEPEARGAASDTPTAIGTDPACRQETAELNRVRATPDLSDAKRFASGITCAPLKPQVARLLESLGE